MIRIEHSVVINRPLEEVFAVVGNPEYDPRWSSTIVDAWPTSPGPLGVGATFQHVGEFMGRQLELPVEVTEYVPNRSVVIMPLAGPIQFASWRVVEPVPGGTHVIIGIEGQIAGVSRFAEPLIAGAARRQLNADLMNLKYMLEGQR
jgi:hypothetical protein